MGSKEENLIKQAKRMNQPIPDRILNKPVLAEHLILYYDAFFELQYDKNENNRVSWSTLVNYSDRNGFDDEQQELLIRFMRVLETAFINWSTKGSKKNGKPERSGK